MGRSIDNMGRFASKKLYQNMFYIAVLWILCIMFYSTSFRSNVNRNSRRHNSKNGKDNSFPIDKLLIEEYPELIRVEEREEFLLAKVHNFEIYVHHPKFDPWLSKFVIKNKYREFETDFLKTTIDALTQRGPQKINILDIGANIGYFSLLAASHSDKVHVTAIEGHPHHYKLLERSLQLQHNSFFNNRVTLIPVGVSNDIDAGKLMCMKMLPDNNAFSLVKFSDDNDMKEFPCTMVPISTIDRLLADPITVIPKNYHIMKLSLQGFDIKAFRGAQKTIMTHYPKVIILDYNHNFLISEIRPRLFVEELFLDHDYSSIFVEGPQITITNIAQLREFFNEEAFYKTLPSGQTNLYFKHRRAGF